MRIVLIVLIAAGCSGRPLDVGDETEVAALCPDARVLGDWSEVDVSGREPLFHDGSARAVIGHVLAFAPDRMTERWILDGATVEGSIAYNACAGDMTFRPDPSPLAGGEVPLVPYSVDAGRLQLGGESYRR